MRCFSCNASVALGAAERVGFRDCCERCAADLHVCRNCRHRDPGAHNECREPGAERVSDRERANRCDWFAPADGPGEGPADPRGSARDALDTLFKKD